MAKRIKIPWGKVKIEVWYFEPGDRIRFIDVRKKEIIDYGTVLERFPNNEVYRVDLDHPHNSPSDGNKKVHAMHVTAMEPVELISKFKEKHHGKD